MKKLLSLMLIALVLTSFSACGESDYEEDDEKIEEEEEENEEQEDEASEDVEADSDTPDVSESEAEDIAETEPVTEAMTEAETEPETAAETTESERLWEIEDNNSPETATKIELGLDYFGNLSADYKTEEDWYEFTLTEETKVYLTFRPGKQMYSDSYWDISIRTAENPDEDHWQKHVGGNIGTSVSPTWLLPAGTYYIELESSNKHSAETYSVNISTRS